MAAARFLVHGRVQGVGFRWFVLREAERLGVRGVARNLPDGAVEVIAEGTEQALTALERVVRLGPARARVEAVEKLDVPHEVRIPNRFEVR